MCTIHWSGHLLDGGGGSAWGGLAWWDVYLGGCLPDTLPWTESHTGVKNYLAANMLQTVISLKFLVAQSGTQLPTSECLSRFLVACGYWAPTKSSTRYAWQGACMAGGMPPWHYEIWSVNARAVHILLECILFLVCPYVLLLFMGIKYKSSTLVYVVHLNLMFFRIAK